MLYIEASQINSNGGIVLLDLLLRRIKERACCQTGKVKKQGK